MPQALGLSPSFGFGDRIGLATPGHVAAMQRAGQGIEPIFPQQSIREMARTQRSPEQVMRDALEAAGSAGWTGRIGADADHLKTTDDVDRTASAGFTFFTIDPSGHVDQHADDYTPDEVNSRYLAGAPVAWMGRYVGRSVKLTTGATIEFDESTCRRAALKYGDAIAAAIRLAAHIRAVCEVRRQEFEIELSVDETEQPTSLAEHYIIAEQCLQHGVKLVSLAPRYIGQFEKGVDYKGDCAQLERSLEDHVAIADALGGYKLSLHSGSDKLSMYPAFARATRGRFHVKTAGTSYLEALRVAARHEPALFRRIVAFARDRYDADKATYHVSATLAGVPPEQAIPDDLELERVYLERWEDVPAGRGFTAPGRQILHCTFGSTLMHDELGPLLRRLLERRPDAYRDILADHFARHLEALRRGMESSGSGRAAD
jgi:hypothetical protein